MKLFYSNENTRNKTEIKKMLMHYANKNIGPENNLQVMLYTNVDIGTEIKIT